MSGTERVPLVQVRNLIAPGSPLPFRVLDGEGRLLLGAGHRVVDADQLRALLERGACVEYAEVEAARKAQADAPVAAGGLTPSSRRLTWFDAWEKQLWALDALLRTLGRDPGQCTALDALVDAQLRLLQSHPDCALFLAVRQDDRRFALYALTHAMHTMSVAVLCAGVLGWAPSRVRALAGAALTMNASIVELQAQMAEQAEPPTKRQIEQIHAHPQRSAELLRASGVTDADWLAAVEDHHERAGGGGYPRALQAVHETAQVLRAADTFTAKISPRALRAAMAPQQAARQLFQEEAGGPVAGALIKAVGVYPPGEFVQLSSGETAIVARRSAAGNAPLVIALRGANGRPVSGPPQRDTADAAWAIGGVLADRSGLPRVLPEQVFGLVYP